MSNKLANQENHPENPALGAGTTEQGQVDASRRKFTGAGIGMSAFFTLASQPVLAAVTCKSPSGFASGNLSQRGTPVTCSGQSPDQWVLITTPDAILDAKFHSVFARSASVNYGGTTTADGPSMKEVMAMPAGATAPQPLGREFAAALVNIRKGLIPATILTETRLITMWNELLATGTFTPMAGVTPWTPAQVIIYLQSLQG